MYYLASFHHSVSYGCVQLPLLPICRARCLQRSEAELGAWICEVWGTACFWLPPSSPPKILPNILFLLTVILHLIIWLVTSGAVPSFCPSIYICVQGILCYHMIKVVPARDINAQPWILINFTCQDKWMRIHLGLAWHAACGMLHADLGSAVLSHTLYMGLIVLKIGSNDIE